MPRIVAIIPARGGSKGLPGKNVRLLAGIPLIAHTIRAARDCSLIDRVVVTTDDHDIGAVSRQFGADVVDRPSELATDTSPSQDAVRHAVLQLSAAGDRPDLIALLQPTSPLRRGCHLSECIESFLASGARSAISVTECEHHPFKSFRIEGGLLIPLFSAEASEMPRQLLPRTYRPNGAIYLIGTDVFLTEDTFITPPIRPYIMPAESSVDIDTALDLEIAGYLLGKSQAAS